jgi:pimeloyl-ACP methyl ester carboxylesterase
VLGPRLAFMDRIIGPEHDPELEAALGEMLVPTMAVFGTKDGVFGTFTAHHYARIIPQCSIQFVYDAAHDLAGDRPDAFAELAIDFLQRGMSFAITHRPTLLNP